MIEESFALLTLTKRELKVLKKAKRKRTVPYDASLDSLIGRKLLEYCAYGRDAIGQQIPVQHSVKITERGRVFLRYRKIEKAKYWIPIIIADLLSIAALIVSILK